jgi:hypothetical protein
MAAIRTSVAILSIVLAAGVPPAALTRVLPLGDGVAVSVESSVGDVEFRAL